MWDLATYCYQVGKIAVKITRFWFCLNCFCFCFQESYGRADELVANEALANHLRCNNSFVLDLFQAQYRSSLTCPRCRQHSTTFDPFMCLSLPIPQRETRPMAVTVVFLNSSRVPLRIGITMKINGTICDLREAIAEMTLIPQTSLVITELYYDGFHRTFQWQAITECDPWWRQHLCFWSASHFVSSWRHWHKLTTNCLIGWQWPNSRHCGDPFGKLPGIWKEQQEVCESGEGSLVRGLLSSLAEQGLIVWRVDNFIQWINPYAMGKICSLSNQN